MVPINHPCFNFSVIQVCIWNHKSHATVCLFAPGWVYVSIWFIWINLSHACIFWIGVDDPLNHKWLTEQSETKRFECFGTANVERNCISNSALRQQFTHHILRIDSRFTWDIGQVFRASPSTSRVYGYSRILVVWLLWDLNHWIAGFIWWVATLIRTLIWGLSLFPPALQQVWSYIQSY